METVRFSCLIEKAEPERRRFFGRAYITDNGQQVIDHSGDVIDTPEAQSALEDAFYDFVKEGRSGDAGHELFDAATLIEGFVVTKEKKSAGIFPESMAEGLYVGFEANDSESGDVLWEGVKSGQYRMLSLVGEGEREPI